MGNLWEVGDTFLRGGHKNFYGPKKNPIFKFFSLLTYFKGGL